MGGAEEVRREGSGGRGVTKTVRSCIFCYSCMHCAFVSVQIIGIGLKICGCKWCMGVCVRGRRVSPRRVRACVSVSRSASVFCAKLSAVWLANFIGLSKLCGLDKGAEYRSIQTVRCGWHSKWARGGQGAGDAWVAVTTFDCWSAKLQYEHPRASSAKRWVIKCGCGSGWANA